MNGIEKLKSIAKYNQTVILLISDDIIELIPRQSRDLNMPEMFKIDSPEHKEILKYNTITNYFYETEKNIIEP